MKYPYSSSNISFRALIAGLFRSRSKSEKFLRDFFIDLTGKKYILFTNSCRTALFLAYKACDIKGEVITSPLTCKVSVDPIFEAGLTAVFTDVSLSDLNMDTEDIEHRISASTRVIQATHIGGNSCKMDKILQIARKHKLLVIEDCAQAFRAKYKFNYTGSFGDISCFSLIKNAYGIGGGVLATNDQIIYSKAHKLMNTFGKLSLLLLLFRVVRSVIETKRNTFLGNLLFELLLKIKGNKKSYKSIMGQLNKITKLELGISSYQIANIEKFHNKRKLLGREYFNQLISSDILVNDEFDLKNSSFTKMYVFDPRINSGKTIDHLRKKGIEAMHLEARQGSPVQPMLINEINSDQQGLKRYMQVHNSLISLPLCENFTIKDIRHIVKEIKTTL